MWICFNDGFVSAVDNSYDRTGDTLKVRARRPEILKRLFPNLELIVTDNTDYRYRVIVSKAAFAEIVAANIKNISYDNFKDSVKDDELHDLYADFWTLHWRYQHAALTVKKIARKAFGKATVSGNRLF